MTAGRLNFDNRQSGACEQGATFKKVLTFKDSNGTLVSLLNHTAKLQVRKNYNDDLIVEMSTTNSKIVINTTINTLTILLSATETSNLPPGSYLYDLKLTDTLTGEVSRVIQGTFLVIAEVTT